MPDRNQPPRRQWPKVSIWRPVFTLFFALLFVYALSEKRAAVMLSSKLPPYTINEKTASTLLRAETAGWDTAHFDWTDILWLESSLLRIVPAQVSPDPVPSPDPPPEQTPSLPDAASGDPPLMNPVLDIPLTPSPEPTPAVLPSIDPSVWDDRIWPSANADDPKAKPLREVTLLPRQGDENVTDGSVRVLNDTDYSIDISALLKKKSVLKANGKDGPQILIIHTHGSESYLPDERHTYVPTDIERTEDTRYNVVRLGDEMERIFTEMGLAVVHDRHIHDYPTYADSYRKTLECITAYKEKFPSLQIVLDIHRDSIASSDGTMYKVVSDTQYGKAAQMMFVVGTDSLGLPHDGWRNNLSFAAQMQDLLLENNPTFMRPIHIRRERFNQHATAGSLIVEIGTAGNTLTEALTATNLFCQTVGPYLKEHLLQ